MRAKRLTIMLVRDHGGPVHSLQISRNKIIAAFAVLAAVFVATASLVGFALRQTGRGADQRTLDGRNRVLMAEVNHLEARLGDFQTLMQQQIRRENTLRVLANLSPLDEDVWKVGVGGREAGTSRFALLGDPDRRRLYTLASGVDELLRQAELQKEIYHQIETAFVKQKERLAATPSIPPVKECPITSGFGHRPDPFTGETGMHAGLDFSAPRGMPVHATADGVVRLAGPYENYGNCVEIDHGQGVVTRYAHNSSIKVRVGQKVKRGDVISFVGMTGRATAPHCHYEVLLNGRPVDPDQYILPGGVVYD